MPSKSCGKIEFLYKDDLEMICISMANPLPRGIMALLADEWASLPQSNNLQGWMCKEIL